MNVVAGYTYRTVNRALISVCSESRLSNQKQQQQQQQQQITTTLFLSPTAGGTTCSRGGRSILRAFRDSAFNDARSAFTELKRYAGIFLNRMPEEDTDSEKRLLLACILNFATVFRMGPEWRHIVVIWIHDAGLLPLPICACILDFLIVIP